MSIWINRNSILYRDIGVKSPPRTNRDAYHQNKDLRNFEFFTYMRRVPKKGRPISAQGALCISIPMCRGILGDVKRFSSSMPRSPYSAEDRGRSGSWSRRARGERGYIWRLTEKAASKANEGITLQIANFWNTFSAISCKSSPLPARLILNVLGRSALGYIAIPPSRTTYRKNMDLCNF